MKTTQHRKEPCFDPFIILSMIDCVTSRMRFDSRAFSCHCRSSERL